MYDRRFKLMFRRSSPVSHQGSTSLVAHLPFLLTLGGLTMSAHPPRLTIASPCVVVA